ncbi:hypothetical protein N0V90_012875 [Kalmusia sp. IMI 367209]|nr:hypothetical protein N0V90_012875 [Kalmusia sp. IMI 367209]
MCFGAFFGTSSQKRKRNRSVPREKRRSEKPETLRGGGAPVVAEKQWRKPSEQPTKKRSRDSREREGYRSRPTYENVHGGRTRYKPTLAVEVPTMWYRPPGSKKQQQQQQFIRGDVAEPTSAEKRAWRKDASRQAHLAVDAQRSRSQTYQRCPP